MSRIYDNLHFIQGSFVTDGSPLDDRFVVQTQADLFLDATWEDRGIYSGLFTVVINDSIPENNGIYVLKSITYRDKQSWDSSSAETYSPNGWFRVGAVMDTFLSGVTVMKGTDISDYNTAHDTNYDTTKVYLKFVFTTKPDGMTPVQQDIIVDVSDFYDSTDAFLWVTFSKATHSNGAMTSNKNYSQIETAINDGKLVIGEYQPNVSNYPKQYFMIPVHINSSTLLFANMSPNTANEVLYISVTSSAVTLEIEKDYAIPDVAGNDGKVLTANANYDLVEWTTLPTPPTFNEGLGVNIETDTTNNTVTISAESNHTVIGKQTIIRSEPGKTLDYYSVLCDLNGVTVRLVDTDDVVTSEHTVPYENHYVWEKQANESDKYIGLCTIDSTVGKYVFKLEVNNTDTDEFNIYYYCLLCDSPSDSTFTFVSTNQWEIIVRVDASIWKLYAYLKVPNEFVGTVTLTPLRGNDNNNLGKIWSFDYKTGTTLRKYRWRDEVLDGTQSLDLLTELIGYESQSTDSTASNYLRPPGGNYYVNIIGSFGGDLTIGSNIADNIVNDFFIHNLDQRLTSTNAAIVQSDWSQTTITAPDYIKNKPSLVEELNDLSDTTITSPSNDQILKYNSTSSRWENDDAGYIDVPEPLPTNTDGTIIEHIVQDYDGNWYDGVVLNNQIWLKQNLRTTHSYDGTEISLGDTYSASVAYRYYPEGDATNVNVYGMLYNWNAISSLTMFDGWHVPTQNEYVDLLTYIYSKQEYIFNNDQNNNAKAVAYNALWEESSTNYSIGKNIELNNATNFSIIPSGQYDGEYFYGLNNSANIWTQTSASSNTSYSLCYTSDSVSFSFLSQSKILGNSVRYVMNQTAAQWFAANGGDRYLKNTPGGLVWAKLTDLQPALVGSGTGQNLKTVNGNNLLGSGDITTTELPAVTSSDNGKILIVDNGAWAAQSVPVADSVLYPNSNN